MGKRALLICYILQTKRLEFVFLLILTLDFEFIVVARVSNSISIIESSIIDYFFRKCSNNSIISIIA